MVLAAATAGTGDGHTIEPTVNLVRDRDRIEHHVAAETTGTGGSAPDRVDVDPAKVRGRRCETTDGTPVDPHQLVVAAVLGRIRTIVVDGTGVIAAAGHTRRLFTGALREAIIALDPSCGWPSCNLRAQIAAIDHLTPASRGGPTNPANANVMCDKHNVFEHTANYTVQRQPDGTLTITRPDDALLQPPDAA